MRSFIRQLRPALVSIGLFTVLLGVVYPLVSTAIAQVAFHDKANGSLVERNGKVVGSALIGQTFTAPEYFHPRPSAAGAGYDGAASSGSNLGPLNADFLTSIDERIAAYRTENGLDPSVAVPVDAVTASGSGLDPHISVANAQRQAPRVARERGLALDVVLAQVGDHTDGRSLWVLGEPGVNVLELNLALDGLKG
jgi:K+-transporting ATPase ATPase C chain